jgi:hypothetical protein
MHKLLNYIDLSDNLTDNLLFEFDIEGFASRMVATCS